METKNKDLGMMLSRLFALIEVPNITFRLSLDSVGKLTVNKALSFAISATSLDTSLKIANMGLSEKFMCISIKK